MFKKKNKKGLFLWLLKKYMSMGNFLGVQWLEHCASTAGGMGSMPSKGNKILQTMQCSQKI